MANGIDPSASMAALFGARVRRLRTAAGLTQAELGDRTHVVSTRITQIERASGAKPTLELARALDAALGAEDLLVELWPYVYREAFPDWSRKFMEYAERAVVIRQYAAHVVPGLLQTEDYARAVLGLDALLDGEEQLEERVSARMARQERLGSPDRPELCVILDEAVLRRPIGGHAVMRKQLARLLGAAVRPRRARGHGRLADNPVPAGRLGSGLHGGFGLRPTHRRTGQRQPLQGDLRSAAGGSPAPGHVARHDPDRDGGQLPWRESPVPI